MTTIIIVDKMGTLSELNVKNISEDDLYKKCGYRKKDGFDKRTIWNVTIAGVKYNIELWAKKNGKANTENKYDFPPPIDSELYFCNCCLLSKDDNKNFLSLKISTWLKIYEHLFGGFDDTGDNEISDDELVNVPKHMKTKNGYLKDGFIVDDEIANDNNANDNNAENSDLDIEDDDDTEELEYDGQCEDCDEESSDKTLLLKQINHEKNFEEYEGSELSVESYDYTDED